MQQQYGSTGIHESAKVVEYKGPQRSHRLQAEFGLPSLYGTIGRKEKSGLPVLIVVNVAGACHCRVQSGTKRRKFAWTVGIRWQGFGESKAALLWTRVVDHLVLIIRVKDHSCGLLLAAWLCSCVAIMKFKRRLASIRVSLEDRVVYLAGSGDIEGTTVNDTIYHSSDPLLARGSLLRGTVRIRVTSPCSFRHLRVVLLGTLQTQAIGKAGPIDDGLPAQRSVNLRHEVNILTERSPHFQPGVHE